VHRLDLAFHQTYGVAAAQFDADQLAQLGFHGAYSRCNCGYWALS
jgi:hypothetical protein